MKEAFLFMENKVLRFALETGDSIEETKSEEKEDTELSSAQAEWAKKRLELLKAYDMDPDNETPEMTKIIEASIGQHPE